MKLAISNIAWMENEDNTIYQLMNEYGFRGLEIAPTRFFDNPYYQNDETIYKLKNRINSFNIKLISMQSLHYGESNIKLFGTQEEKDNLLEYTKKAIIFASKLGIKTLVFGSPTIRKINNADKEFNGAISFFRELGVFADRYGTYLCIEPNPVKYNTNFINTTQEAIELVKAVNVKGFKMNYDLSTAIINNESVELIKRAENAINHVHISEPFLELISKERIALHKELLKVLESINYNNWISIEMKKQSETSNIENVRRSLRYIAEIFGGNI